MSGALVASGIWIAMAIYFGYPDLAVFPNNEIGSRN